MQSSRPGPQAAALAATLWIVGCGSQPDSRTVVVGTLPSGIVRVVNSEPWEDEDGRPAILWYSITR